MADIEAMTFRELIEFAELAAERKTGIGAPIL